MLFDLLVDPPGADPEQVTIVDGERCFTRKELVSAVLCFAEQLHEKGVGPGTTAAFCMSNSLEQVIAYLAGIRLQARLLLLDPADSASGIAGLCDRAESRVLVTDGAQPIAAAAGLPEIIEIPLAKDLLTGPADESCLPGTVADDRTTVLFLSSGSTGTPNVVVNTAPEIAASIAMNRTPWPFVRGDRIAVVLPLFHIWGLRHMFGSGLGENCTIYMLPSHPRLLASAIEKHRITILPATPMIFRMLVETDYATCPDFSSLRLAFTGGAPMPAGVAARFLSDFDVPIYHLYGSTEADSGMICDATEPDPVRGWPWRPWPSVEVTVRDKSGAEVPPETAGMIAVSSPACTREYLGDPGATAATYRDGYVLTGDLGIRDAEGRIFLLGRARPIINVAGQKVAPAEVEACLRTHPEVIHTQVLGEVSEDGDERVKALVTVSGPVTARALREYCAERLAAYKVPRQIEFIEAVATGPLGKPRLEAGKE